MRAPDGGFYSAKDADSEGVEGKFYVWTAKQIEVVLGKADAAFADTVFGVDVDGNIHDEATGEKQVSMCYTWRIRPHRNRCAGPCTSPELDPLILA